MLSLFHRISQAGLIQMAEDEFRAESFKPHFRYFASLPKGKLPRCDRPEDGFPVDLAGFGKA